MSQSKSFRNKIESAAQKFDAGCRWHRCGYLCLRVCIRLHGNPQRYPRWLPRKEPQVCRFVAFNNRAFVIIFRFSDIIKHRLSYGTILLGLSVHSVCGLKMDMLKMRTVIEMKAFCFQISRWRYMELRRTHSSLPQMTLNIHFLMSCPKRLCIYEMKQY